MLITLKHKQRCLEKLAEHKTQKPAPTKARARTSQPRRSAVPARGENAVVFAALHQDLEALKQHTDVAKKIELKKSHLIPKWERVIEDYIESGERRPFEPLVRLVIWLLDAEAIDRAINLADLAIEQQQPMPDGFNRPLPTFVAESFHDWAERQYKAGHSAEPFLADVIKRVESRRWPVNEPIVLNKLYKLVGQFAEVNNDLAAAEAAYVRCVEVNPDKHGVKTRLEAVRKKLGK